MPNQVGEIAVAVKEEGTQDALDNMADASAESGGGARGKGRGGSSQGGGGGGIADILGGISKKLIAILGLVMFLASLKPIQELLSGIQRLFSVAILPLVGLLLTFLRPILQDLLKFIANLDFDNLLQDLIQKLPGVLAGMAEQVANAIAEVLPLINPAGEGGGGPTLSEKLKEPNPVERRPDLFRQDGPIPVHKDSVAADVFVQLGWLSEQSNTTLDSDVAETNNSEIRKKGPGGN